MMEERDKRVVFWYLEMGFVVDRGVRLRAVGSEQREISGVMCWLNGRD